MFSDVLSRIRGLISNGLLFREIAKVRVDSIKERKSSLRQEPTGVDSTFFTSSGKGCESVLVLLASSKLP